MGPENLHVRIVSGGGPRTGPSSGHKQVLCACGAALHRQTAYAIIRHRQIELSCRRALWYQSVFSKESRMPNYKQNAPFLRSLLQLPVSMKDGTSYKPLNNDDLGDSDGPIASESHIARHLSRWERSLWIFLTAVLSITLGFVVLGGATHRDQLSSYETGFRTDLSATYARPQLSVSKN